MTQPIYLCDIDGTIADISHRLHFIQQEKPDWRGFYAACPGDKPIPDVIGLIKHIGKAAEILMLTGRSEEIRPQTLKWLRENGVPCQALYMREEGDHRQDSIVKAEFLEHVIANWRGQEILGAFEDRKQVVDMYRAKGIRVYQVADGNF